MSKDDKVLSCRDHLSGPRWVERSKEKKTLRDLRLTRIARNLVGTDERASVAHQPSLLIACQKNYNLHKKNKKIFKKLIITNNCILDYSLLF